MVAYMDAHPRVGVLGPRTVTRDLALRQNCRRFPTLANAAGDYLMLKRILPGVERFEGRTLKASTYSTTHEAEVLSGCFMMVRREAFDEVGPLDEDFFFYGEDTDWCKRFHDAGWKVVYFADARGDPLRWRQHQGVPREVLPHHGAGRSEVLAQAPPPGSAARLSWR